MIWGVWIVVSFVLLIGFEGWWSCIRRWVLVLSVWCGLMCLCGCFFVLCTLRTFCAVVLVLVFVLAVLVVVVVVV